MTAPGLDDAIELVNRIDYGLTSGLQSLDSGEIAHWAQRVEAGNLYVNRHITGAIVRRQPFGGWKRASVGDGCKAGGPNYLLAFGSWRDDPDSVGALEQVAEDPITGSTLAAAREADVSPTELAWLRTALATDLRAWHREFHARDVTGLRAENNVLRYRPVPVTIRVQQATDAQLLRIVAAAGRAQAQVIVSTAEPLPEPVQRHLDQLGLPTHVENRVQWGARAAQLAAGGGRVRLLGGSSAELAAAVSGSPALAIYAGEVVSAGRIELLTFLREQAISITAHRFGTPRTTGSHDPLNPYAAADADDPAGAPRTGLVRRGELRRALRGWRAAGGDRR